MPSLTLSLGAHRKSQPGVSAVTSASAAWSAPGNLARAALAAHLIGQGG